MPLDEFAAAVAATDLLVTVDTMAAHCAGALGHPVWLMLPLSPHWCWGIGRGQTPWYPTARLSRQAARRTGRIHSRSSRASSVRYQLNIN
jgi:ADP-heptose:LPS heptosyltransferase